VDHRPLVDPGGDEDGRDADAEAVEGEVVGRRADDAVGAGDAADGGGDVVEEAAVLVVGEHHERLVPLRAGAERLVDLLDEHLAPVDVVGGVVVVGGAELGVEVVLLDDGVVWEGAAAGVVGEGGVERVEVQQVLEPAEVAVEEHRRHVLEVDAERQARVVDVVEDGLLRVAPRQKPALCLCCSSSVMLSFFVVNCNNGSQTVQMFTESGVHLL
jgi:hypothetical protein